MYYFLSFDKGLYNFCLSRGCPIGNILQRYTCYNTHATIHMLQYTCYKRDFVASICSTCSICSICSIDLQHLQHLQRRFVASVAFVASLAFHGLIVFFRNIQQFFLSIINCMTHSMRTKVIIHLTLSFDDDLLDQFSL